METTYEVEILRLNLYIKELLGNNEELTRHKRQLKKTTENLSIEVEDLRKQTAQLSQLNLRYKIDLEKATQDRENIFTAHQRQKHKINSFAELCLKQTEKIKSLDEVIRKQTTLPGIVPKPSVDIIGSISDLKPAINSADQDHKQQEKINEMKNEIENLKHKLENAHDLIEELEFEMETLDVYRMENERLNNELKTFKATINGKETDEKFEHIYKQIPARVVNNKKNQQQQPPNIQPTPPPPPPPLPGYSVASSEIATMTPITNPTTATIPKTSNKYNKIKPNIEDEIILDEREFKKQLIQKLIQSSMFKY